MHAKIKEIAKIFLEKTRTKGITIVSHNDTDGITSAAILAKTLNQLDRRFAIKIIKGLEPEIIVSLPKNQVTIFLDLASSSLNHLKYSDLEDIFIIDHHEISQPIPEKVSIINPHLHNEELMSGSCLTYLFCKELTKRDKTLATLAVIGLVGDTMEKNLGKIKNEILHDAEATVRKSLLLYPATRPVNKTLEYTSEIYIPNVTGSASGAIKFLNDIGIKKENNRHKSLMELTDEEMKKLVTAIMLSNPQDESNIVGNLFLVKFFNKLEDAREISGLINACSRFGETGTAVSMCLGNPNSLKTAQTIHARYRKELTEALSSIPEIPKIQGNGFVIINSREKIKDTMIGTVTSILSNSKVYTEGTVLIGMSYSGEKIKVSSRLCGKRGRNVKEILDQVHSNIGGECGGHEFAAGSLFERNKEQEFLQHLVKTLEMEIIKV